MLGLEVPFHASVNHCIGDRDGADDDAMKRGARSYAKNGMLKARSQTLVDRIIEGSDPRKFLTRPRYDPRNLFRLNSGIPVGLKAPSLSAGQSRGVRDWKTGIVPRPAAATRDTGWSQPRLEIPVFRDAPDS
jgi:hypothetical protein